MEAGKALGKHGLHIVPSSDPSLYICAVLSAMYSASRMLGPCKSIKMAEKLVILIFPPTSEDSTSAQKQFPVLRAKEKRVNMAMLTFDRTTSPQKGADDIFKAL